MQREKIKDYEEQKLDGIPNFGKDRKNILKIEHDDELQQYSRSEIERKKIILLRMQYCCESIGKFEVS